MSLTVRIPDDLAGRLHATGASPERLALDALRRAADELERARGPGGERTGEKFMDESDAFNGGLMSDADGLDEEGSLTLAAKDAVRGYMLRLVAIPTVLLTAISGIGGFFLDKVAYREGYLEAYQIAVKDIISTAKELGETKGYATDALADVK